MATSYPSGRIEAGVPLHELFLCRHCGLDLIVKGGKVLLCSRCDAPEPEQPL